jgi:hypothetical protein
MKNLILLIYLSFIFISKMNAQHDYRVSISPLQFQYFYSSVEKHPAIDTSKIAWGFSIHPELLFKKKINSKIDLLLGLGFLFSSEKIPIKGSVRNFLNNTELDASTLTVSEASLTFKKVFVNDIILTLPVGVRYNFFANSRRKFFLQIKPETGLLNYTKKEITLETCSSSSFGGLGGEDCYDRDGPLAKKIIKEYLSKNENIIYFNTQLGIGYTILDTKKTLTTLKFNLDMFHLHHRKGLLKKRKAFGFNFGLEHSL